jgi:chromosome segregation ATPase
MSTPSSVKENWKEPKNKQNFIFNKNNILLNNNLSVEGVLNLNNDDDDNNNNNIHLLNINTVQNDLNKKTCYASICFNTKQLNNENKWIVGTGMDDYVGNINDFGIININNGYSGVYLQPNNSTWFSLSDARLKNVISNIDNCLDKISKINPIYYKWKQDTTDTLQVGVIAQEVLAVFKEAVAIPKDTDKQFYSVSYTNLIPLLIGGIQELQTQVSNNHEILMNNNKLINSNNSLIFEIKNITEINKQYIDLKNAELKLNLEDKINTSNNNLGLLSTNVKNLDVFVNTKVCNDITNLSTTIQINEDNINNLEIKYNNINTSFNNLEIKYNNINTSFNKYIDKENILIEHINDELKKIHINIDNVDTLNSCIAKINDMNFNIKKLNLSLDNLSIKVNKNEEQDALSQLLHDESDKNINKLITELNLFTYKNKELENKNKTLDNLINDLLKKNTLLEEKLNILGNKNQSLQNDIAVLNNKNNTLEKIINDNKDTIHHNSDKIVEQQKNFNIYKNKLDILQNMITTLQKKI